MCCKYSYLLTYTTIRFKRILIMRILDNTTTLKILLYNTLNPKYQQITPNFKPNTCVFLLTQKYGNMPR